MKIVKWLVCTSLLISTSNLLAEDLWTGVKQILSVQVLNNGGFMLNLDSEISPQCNYSGNSTLLIYPNQNGVTDAGARSLLSTALVAFSAGHAVNIMYSSSSSYCWGKYLLISK
ncbi:MAG: hypothetical protein H8E21_12555 [Gammaproteobacteria bacterium]|nr:hypothetical protein [Gammaproteobacteria bacterium]MBL6998354.1 hypothetical protein [Gammaproteobacteria bacterium]